MDLNHVNRLIIILNVTLWSKVIRDEFNADFQTSKGIKRFSLSTALLSTTILIFGIWINFVFFVYNLCFFARVDNCCETISTTILLFTWISTYLDIRDVRANPLILRIHKLVCEKFVLVRRILLFFFNLICIDIFTKTGLVPNFRIIFLIVSSFTEPTLGNIVIILSVIFYDWVELYTPKTFYHLKFQSLKRNCHRYCLLSGIQIELVHLWVRHIIVLRIQ